MTNDRDREPELTPEQAEKNAQDLRTYAHLQHTLTYHELLLSDKVRNQRFQQAIKKHVGAGSRVLDIGSGTGVWAIEAARLGASKVVAIEKDPMLIPIIEKLAAKNGVKDRLEIVTGDSREVKVSGKFDVIITETVGNYGFDEEIVPIVLDARKRFMKKGGVVIPCAVTTVVAPAHLKNASEPLPAGLKLDFRFLEILNLDISKKLNDGSAFDLLARPAPLAHVDLMTVKEPPALTDMKCKWKVKDASQLNCLIVSAQILLTKGVSLATINHSSGWNPVCLPLEPLPAGPAVIECTITNSNKQYYWVVSHVKNGQRRVQSHSPMFPYTVIQSRLQQS